MGSSERYRYIYIYVYPIYIRANMNPIKFWEVEVLIFVLFNSFIPSMICSSMKDRVLAFTFLGGNIDGLIAIFWNLVICFSTAIVRVKGIAKSENSVFPIYKSVYNLHIYISQNGQKNGTGHGWAGGTSFKWS